MSSEPNTRESDDELADQSDQSTVVIPAIQLFGEHREICIEHNGEVYRLRITRRNKLILQK